MGGSGRRGERRVEGGEGPKGTLREQVWAALVAAHAARFPGARGRIPNFVGAEAAARRLAGLAVWQRARTIKANPDAPQRLARQLALEAGKTLFMAVPRLATEAPFLTLDPASLERRGVSAREASSIDGAARHGRPARPDELPPIDLVLVGSVAVSRDGARLGKGGGYSDLEYALARELGMVGEATPVVTLVHPVQLVEAGAIPMTRHDVPVDWIVTPEQAIETRTRHPRPAGVYDEDLPDEKRRAIPLLAARGSTR